MQCRKVRLVLRYDMLNIHLAPQKFANHALLLFYPLKDEKIAIRFSTLEQNKL